MGVRFVTSKLIPAAATLGVAVTVYSSTATAFFPPIPVGSQVVTVPPVSPQIPVVPVVPPVVPPTIPPVVPPPPPPTPNEICPDPQEIPEPATITAALIGLGAVAAGGLRKKLKK
jgi:hypothetical protein